MDKRKTVGLIVNILLLLAAFAVIAFIGWRFLPEILHLIKDPARFKHYIESFGAWGILVFAFFQVLQVVVAIIPGEFIQLAGGYIYGTFMGTIYSMIGIGLGTAAAFWIAKGLGYRILKKFISDQTLGRFTALLDNPRADIITFLLFLIPGLPKDLLVYAAGLTPIKPMRFLTICMVARFPAILASAFVGANLQEKDYNSVIIVSSIACLLFVLGFLYRDKITQWVSRGPLDKLLRKKDNR